MAGTSRNMIISEHFTMLGCQNIEIIHIAGLQKRQKSLLNAKCKLCPACHHRVYNRVAYQTIAEEELGSCFSPHMYIETSHGFLVNN